MLRHQEPAPVGGGEAEDDDEVRPRKLTSARPRVESAWCFNSLKLQCFQAIGFKHQSGSCTPLRPLQREEGEAIGIRRPLRRVEVRVGDGVKLDPRL